jgi:hypothetical protein
VADLCSARASRCAGKRCCSALVGARPAFAHERLAWTADGQIAYRPKRPWRDGRTELRLPPAAFLPRLCARSNYAQQTCAPDAQVWHVQQVTP